MASTAPKKAFKKNFKQLISFLFLILVFFVLKSDTALASHEKYWFQSGYANGCGKIEYHMDCGNKDCDTWSDFTCGKWQKSEASSISWKEKDGDNKTTWYARCYCDIACLDMPTNPRYNDDPSPQNHANNDTAKITLPVALSWNNVPGWKNLGKNIATCTGKDSYCEHSKGYAGNFSKIEGANNFGPQSYLIEIQDTTSENGIDNFNFAPLSDDDTNPNTEYAKPRSSGRIKTIGGKKAFYKVLDTNIFNSVTDAWPCFFNSSGKYRWRVKPCCDTFGENCKEYGDNEGWWYFSVNTAPELIGPTDADWNGEGPAMGNEAAQKSFKDIREGVDPLKWCSAKLPDELQEKERPTRYAESYQLYITSDENNDIVNGIQNAIDTVTSAYHNLVSWLTGNSDPQTPAEKQKTHALSVINGQIISDVFPNPVTGEVETWYPAQSRGDLAYFTRNRAYSWTLKSCPNNDTRDEFEDREDNNDCYEDSSQKWRIVTKDEDIPAPEPIDPKDDPSGDNPVGLPISIVWSTPAGANSYQYNTDIGNLTRERNTTWNTIPNKETAETDPDALTLNDAAIKLDTVYHWKVRSCAEFNSTDCDEWSKDYSFITTGRPPGTNTMKPDLGSTINYPQNFFWEHVGGARAYAVELYDANYQLLTTQTVKFNDENDGQPSTQFDYPNITQPAKGTANTTYHWRVKTCADEEIKYCGGQSEYQNFTVYRVAAPILTSEKNEFGSLRELKLEWESQTKNNLITITYAGGSTQDGCSTGNSITNFKSTDKACTFFNGCIDQNSKLSCAGTYTYMIYPCVDTNCSDRGEAIQGTFLIKATGSSETIANFRVCGQNSDNLDTGYDETAECSIGSFFLVVKLIINFLLFKVAFLLLPVLAMISGGMFYLGMKGKDTIPTIKNMWKYAGWGYGIMFMAWLLVSWLIAATGYEGIAWYQVF